MLNTLLFGRATARPRTARSLPLTLLCAVLTQACAAPPASSANPVPSTDAAPAMQQLQSAIGDAGCDRTTQCHALPVGSKACGGPQSYLPYSERTGNDNQIQLLAQRYASLQRAQHAARGELSDCGMRLAPSAICAPDGHCVLQYGNANNPDPR